ncbi:T6SS immunity protein Tdi1 domain-containing protein [Alkalilimnicola ehrlichii]|uniref:T6SS immunity protein Tdi1 domain-containing protein n=1 Tax=Alkalilimnicola ehrlichii TaxID=351052 RepID=UPI0015F28AF7|nr:T6SS immunity protein Tdi1 domain-containing protein [Alkalilimnicola ehrlichii]
MIDGFLKTFPPSSDNIPPTAKQLDKYSQRLPASILELWERGGFGNYGNGEIKIINPDEYEKCLMGWLLRDEVDESRTTVAISSTGTLFYHRWLTDDIDDVSFINPHTSETDVCTYSGSEFLAVLADDREVREELLNPKMFEELTKRFGEIPAQEIFFYTPALRLGGRESIENVEHGNAVVHLEFLLQLALGK